MDISYYKMEAEEIASLVRYEFVSRKLILQAESTFIGLIKNRRIVFVFMPPLGSYHRMLIHRVADFFNLLHVSREEGSERHIVIKKTKESYIPAILICDALNEENESDDYLPKIEKICLNFKSNILIEKKFSAEADKNFQADRIFSDTVPNDFDTDRKSFGSDRTARKSSDTATKSFGSVRKSSDTAAKSFGSARNCSDTSPKSFGFARTSQVSSDAARRMIFRALNLPQLISSPAPDQLRSCLENSEKKESNMEQH